MLKTLLNLYTKINFSLLALSHKRNSFFLHIIAENGNFRKGYKKVTKKLQNFIGKMHKFNSLFSFDIYEQKRYNKSR